MIKKMTIGIVLAAIILMPASLFAEEKHCPDECPLVAQQRAEKAEQAQQQVPIRRRARALIREQRDEEDAPQTRRGPGRQKGMTEGRDRRRGGMPEGIGGGRGMGLQARGERFDAWMEKLTEAYESNDREEMGRLLRKMKQHRRQMRKEMRESGPRGRGMDRGKTRQFSDPQGEGPERQGRFRREEGSESQRRFRRGERQEGHGRFYESEDFDCRYMRQQCRRGQRAGCCRFCERRCRSRVQEREFCCRCENCPMRFECECCPQLKRHKRRMEQERPGHRMSPQGKNMERRERFYDNEDDFYCRHRDRFGCRMRR
ncbi:MAG: hypothetical protein ACYTBV_04420 [Planctomycetota bacterium]